MALVKSADQIKKIRQSARILADTLRHLSRMVRVGTNLMELERFARSNIQEHGGTPAFFGYIPTGAREAYPFALCTSLNEVIVHGRPFSYKLQRGDILKLDLGVNWKGGISDAAVTVAVGEISKQDVRLIKITQEALAKGISEAKPGNTVGDIGYAIESTVTNGGGHVVDSLSGHGTGNTLHEEPSVYNFGKQGEGMPLKPGMVIAIEPMVSMSSGKVIQLKDDSYATADNSNSAHFEHTILITEGGNEVLTR